MLVFSRKMKQGSPRSPLGLAGIPLALTAILPLASCVHVKVDPVRIDATVTIRVERELDDFFNAIDAKSKTIGANGIATPAAQGGL